MVPRASHLAEGNRPRGTIIVAVLLVVTLSALAATAALYLGEATTSGADASLRRVRARALAWSGVQAVMAELDTQRDQLLDGESPLLTTQWQLFEEGSRRGIVRLVALERDEAGLERWAVSECTRLNVNLATPEMLGNLGGISESQAAAIHAGRPYASVEELVRVAPDLLEDEAPMEPWGNEADGSRPASQLTVMSFDPNVQSGIETFSGRGADSKGKLRVNLHTAWSDDLAEAIRARFDSTAVNVAKSMFDAGEKFKTTGDLVAVLRRGNLSPDAWPPILDTFTTTPDPFVPGRIDINRAPARVIAAIPGVGPDAAEAIVRVRHSIDATRRRSVAWPVMEGVLSADDFGIAVEWMTTRSMQWRVRVEAGIIDLDQSGTREPELQDRIMLEAVIDIASDRPRVAYLRDVTLLEAADVLKLQQAESADDRISPPEETSGPGVPAGTGASNGADGLNFNAGLRFGSSEQLPPAPRQDQTNVGPPPPEPAPVGVDRRIGRWTSQTGTQQGGTQP